MTNLEYDARDVMEQIQMAESRHMQMGALVSYQLQYPDMTIRDFLVRNYGYSTDFDGGSLWIFDGTSLEDN